MRLREVHDHREELEGATSKKAPRPPVPPPREDERGPRKERSSATQREKLPPPRRLSRDDERNDSTKKDDKDDRKKDRDDEKDSMKKDDKDDRKKGDKKEKHKKKDKKMKDDKKKVADDRKKDKPKKEEKVPQARVTVKKALATPSVKKGASLGEDLAAMGKRNKKDLSLMLEERKAKEKQLDSVDAQIQAFEEEVTERQTKIKALQLSRTEWLAEIEEQAGAVEKKKNELLETTRLHAKYVKENQSVPESPCSCSSSEYTYEYTEVEEEHW